MPDCSRGFQQDESQEILERIRVEAALEEFARLTGIPMEDIQVPLEEDDDELFRLRSLPVRPTLRFTSRDEDGGIIFAVSALDEADQWKSVSGVFRRLLDIWHGQRHHEGDIVDPVTGIAYKVDTWLGELEVGNEYLGPLSSIEIPLPPLMDLDEFTQAEEILFHRHSLHKKSPHWDSYETITNLKLRRFGQQYEIPKILGEMNRRLGLPENSESNEQDLIQLGTACAIASHAGSIGLENLQEAAFGFILKNAGRIFEEQKNYGMLSPTLWHKILSSLDGLPLEDICTVCLAYRRWQSSQMIHGKCSGDELEASNWQQTLRAVSVD